VIGARCKISSHTFICEGVIIEDGVFIGHGVMFTNDTYPSAVTETGDLQTGADWVLETTTVKSCASIGSGAVILPRHQHRQAGAGRRRRYCHPRCARLRHRGRRSRSHHRRRAHAQGPTYSTQEHIMIGIGVVGYGYWGPNLVRNLWEISGVQLRWVCDLRTERLAGMRNRYPSVQITEDFKRAAQRSGSGCHRHRDPGLDALFHGNESAARRQACVCRKAHRLDGARSRTAGRRSRKARPWCWLSTIPLSIRRHQEDARTGRWFAGRALLL
jgi:hypothetical protein